MVKAVTPYLQYNDQCEEALNFYAKALGGEIKSMMKVKDSPKEYHSPEHNNKVMHSELKVGNATIMASDSMGHDCKPGSNTSLTIHFDSVDEIAAAWKNLSADAKI